MHIEVIYCATRSAFEVGMGGGGGEGGVMLAGGLGLG